MSYNNSKFGYNRRDGVFSAGGSSLLDDLISYWKLDEAAGVARVDSAGSGNTLTDHNTVTTPAGIIEGSAGFNGTTQYLSVASTVSLETGDISYAFSAWLYPTDVSSLRTVMSKGEAGTSVEYVFYIDSADGMLHCQVWNDPPAANDQAISLAPIPLNTWTHMVFMRNKAAVEVQLYINGVVQDNNAITIAPTAHSGDFNLSRYMFTGDRFFAGRIDEVGFWKRVLTTDEIAELYNGGTGLSYPF